MVPTSAIAHHYLISWVEKVYKEVAKASYSYNLSRICEDIHFFGSLDDILGGKFTVVCHIKNVSINPMWVKQLVSELTGPGRPKHIALLEESIAEDIEKATKEKQFFSLPLNNILNIVKKTNLSEQEDPISLIKTIITKTIENHSEEKETLLLLDSLKTNDIELTLEQCVDILSLFTQCNIFIQLNKRFHENDKEVDIDTYFIIEQKEKEIEKLKQ